MAAIPRATRRANRAKRRSHYQYAKQKIDQLLRLVWLEQYNNYCLLIKFVFFKKKNQIQIKSN